MEGHLGTTAKWRESAAGKLKIKEAYAKKLAERKANPCLMAAYRKGKNETDKRRRAKKRKLKDELKSANAKKKQKDKE